VIARKCSRRARRVRPAQRSVGSQDLGQDLAYESPQGVEVWAVELSSFGQNEPCGWSRSRA
jgi:hypothetical protein